MEGRSVTRLKMEVSAQPKNATASFKRKFIEEAQTP